MKLPVINRTIRVTAPLLLVLALAGCTGIPRQSEREARAQAQAAGGVFRPGGEMAPLPELGPEAPLAAYLEHAMLKRPQVAAAYFDWLASVERITVERSLPDPRLMFSTDIREVVMAVMPGLMQEFPGPGKLSARAAVASAESAARYHAFETAVLATAFDAKRAYYRLHFLEDTLRITRENLALLAELEQIARAQNEAGNVTLQDVLRAQIEQDRVATEVENLDDSREALLAEFKAALGLGPEEPDPPVPVRFESVPLELAPEELLEAALRRNPRLRGLAAEVRAAEAGIRLARKSRVPDASIGVEVDVKTAPYMVRPQAGVTLPIWRDKIAAEIAAAQNRKRASEARLSEEEILLAVDVAGRLYALREAQRNLALFRERLVPKARQSLEVARGGYLGGVIDFFNLIDAERTLLNFQLAEVEARLQQELAAAELSLVIVGLPPPGAPVGAGPARERPAE